MARLQLLRIERQLRGDAGVAQTRNQSAGQGCRRDAQDAVEAERFAVGQDGLGALGGAERNDGEDHQQARPDERANVIGRVIEDQQRATADRELEHQLVEAHHAAASGAGR